jgi:pimeloyl-ACP methyl ester carboxylesterase
MGRVRDRFAAVNGLRVHFRDWDGPRSDAPVLVLLHGGMGDSYTWDRFAPIFAAHARVVAPDARGHGESDWSDEGEYGPAHHAADVVALLAALGLDQVSIIGASMGGLTGYHVAAKIPDLVEKLVVVDVSPERLNWSTTPPNRFTSFEEALTARITRPHEHDDPALRESVERNLMLMPDGGFSWRYDLDGIRGGMQSRDADHDWALLQDIKTPTLLVRGADSNVLTTELAQKVCRSIPDAKIIEIAGAGHPVPRDQPAPFLAAVVPFLFD